jgi:hypothetical protein
MVWGLEQDLQSGLGLLHKRLKYWIKMADGGAGLSLQNTL